MIPWQQITKIFCCYCKKLLKSFYLMMLSLYIGCILLWCQYFEPICLVRFFVYPLIKLSFSTLQYRRKGEELKQKLARMKPIVVPSASRIEIKSPTQEKKDMSKEDVASLDDLSKRLTGLRNKINKAMTSKNVVDLHQPSTIDSTEIPAFVPTSKVSSYQCQVSLQL
jgi:hypothetical protein